MYIPSMIDCLRQTFSHLPKEELLLLEELWYYREKLENTTGWFSRWKIKSIVRELEQEAMHIGIREAMNDLEAMGIVKRIN